MAPPSSVLAWKVPWTEGSQRVRHDWAHKHTWGILRDLCSVVSDSVRPHRLHPAMLLCPWDSPGKNTGVGCHFLLHVYHQRTITRSLNSIGTPVKEFPLLRLDHALAHSGSFSSPPGLSRAACTVRHTLQGELSLECDDGRRNRFLKL